MEYPPREPRTRGEWESEVHLTKVRDKLVSLRNQNQERFAAALAAVAETDEFITHGAQLEVFLLKGDEVAKTFARSLEVDYELLISPEYVSVEQMMLRYEE